MKIWLEATRPKTLPAAITPVLVASSLAYVDGGFRWLPALICLAFALLIQVGTNFANDYLDGIKGTDTEARIGPQRAVASGLIAPEVMKRATVVVLAIGFCVGLGLVPYGGPWLLVVGILSVACAWLYTGGPYPLAYNGLGDVFVILFFGLIAVGCTYYVQCLEIHLEVLALGLSTGLLVNNLLVVNNYRDLVEDRQARKRTLIVLLGRGFGLWLYRSSALFAGAILLWMVLRGYSLGVLLGWLPIAVSLRLSFKLPQCGSAVEYLAVLKGTGIVVALFGVLVSVGLLI